MLKSQPTPFEQYQVAGIYAQTSKTHPDDAKLALRCLAIAFREPSNCGHVADDPELYDLRKDYRLQKLLQAVQELNKYDQR